MADSPEVSIPDGLLDAFGEPESCWSIAGRVTISGIRDLRTELLDEGETEIRLWRQRGCLAWDCTILGFYGGEWNGLYLPPITYASMAPQYRFPLPEPACGWQTLVDKVRQLGLLELPDQSELQPREGTVLDGLYYFVEFQAEGRYRCYHYNNPMREPLVDEARRMVETADLLYSTLKFPDLSAESHRDPIPDLSPPFFVPWYQRRTF